MMQCFRVIFELAEPVIAPYGISLDGLLAAAAVRAGADFKTAHLDLPILKTDTIYHASELFFIGPAQTYPVPYVRSLKPEQWDRATFRDGRGHVLRKITARDDYKNLLDKYQAVATPAAVAFGVGEVDAVSALLDHIEAIGKKASSRMCGRLAGISVETTDGDPSSMGLLDANRLPVRNLPIELYRKLGGNPSCRSGAAVPRLPRWKHPPEHCALPASRFIRLEDIS